MHRALCLALLLPAACAPHHVISGSILDRNGQPVERVIVGLQPGGVELVTDAQGGFSIDYLRDANGNRTRLRRRTDYTLSAVKTGFHDATKIFHFTRGELQLDPLTLTEDTIRVEAGVENLDPAIYPDRAQNDGATYEGE
ncbi:MAG: carboxypeptidase regulatory-like domain-containing protein [Deltaproteobacteria bacterium]|nr:carboxypeptidase regulatory-like domain-containing protein [Deltaproteobacteria bacterium]